MPVSPLEHRLHAHLGAGSSMPELEKAVLAGELTPALAAQQLLETFRSVPGD